MPREWTDTTLVLRVGKFREADLWVRLLGQEQGIVTAFAFGGSRSLKRFTGCLDPYNILLSRAAYNRTGNFLNLQETTLLEGPTRLRTDWRVQGLAANALHFLEAMGVPPGNAFVSFHTLRSFLGLLEYTQNPSPLFPVLFRFRVASDQGYVPDLSTCMHCGLDLSTQSHIFMLVAEGLALCPACHGHIQTGMRLQKESLEALRFVQNSDPADWENFLPDPDLGRQISRFIDAFLRYHIGLEWQGGHFRRV